MENKLDWLLATHCSPALAGIKSACLVSCAKALYPDLPHSIANYRNALTSRGICFDVICTCPSRYLLLVYNRNLLARRLSEASVQCVLRKFGYQTDKGLESLLSQLKKRIITSDSFPHEIGLFLGYPIEDVIGFIRYKGQDCKLSGYWKVYGDAETASKLFSRFSRVCSAVKKRLERGETLLEIFSAA